MVMIEAMAKGTPVVALRRGAVPEVVLHGADRHHLRRRAELPDALHEVAQLDPADCVAHVRTSFSVELMARRYERVYRAVIASRTDTRSTRTPAELRHTHAGRSVAT